MELKWHLIEDGKMKGIPRDECLLRKRMKLYGQCTWAH